MKELQTHHHQAAAAAAPFGLPMLSISIILITRDRLSSDGGGFDAYRSNFEFVCGGEEMEKNGSSR